jgi:hypothetical protein
MNYRVLNRQNLQLLGSSFGLSNGSRLFCRKLENYFASYDVMARVIEPVWFFASLLSSISLHLCGHITKEGQNFRRYIPKQWVL